MTNPVAALSLFAVLLVALLPISTAADVAPFDAKAFADAQAAGRSIVVAINADW
jgi:hypothetical protein